MHPPVGGKQYVHRRGPYLAKGGVGVGVRVPPVSGRGWAFSGAQAWLRWTLTSGGSSGWVARAARHDGSVEGDRRVIEAAIERINAALDEPE